MRNNSKFFHGIPPGKQEKLFLQGGNRMDLEQFAWKCFCNSGNIEAFLLHKQEEALKHSAERKNYGIGEDDRDCSAGDKIRRT